MWLSHRPHEGHLPATAREVSDVTGAGDTVIATLAAALAAGAHARPKPRSSPTKPPASWSARFGTAVVTTRRTARALSDARGPRRAERARRQCRKCRRPVNTIARPCSSAAAITSASRTEPPGWTTAVAPAAATASRPSRNGKNASDAATVPASGSAPRRLPAAGLHRRHACTASTRLICPAPTPACDRGR